MSGMYISGLASGIDTDALIGGLMKIEGQALARLEGQKQRLQLKADAWKEVRTRLVNLQQAARDLTRGSLYGQKTASSSDENRVTVTAVSQAASGSYRLEILTRARAHGVAGHKISGEPNLAGTLVINGETIDIGEEDSLQGISQKINSSAAGVKAAVIDRRLVLTRTQTGATEIEIVDSDLSRELGLHVEQEAGTGIYVLNTVQEAADARFRLNGLEITRSSNLIDDVVTGVTFNLLRETDGAVTITVEEDYGEATAKIEDFVKQYNSTYQFVKSLLSVDPDAGKQGILYGESSLNQVLSTIRQTVTGAVVGEGTYTTLFSIGITTPPWNSGQPEGTLLLDKDKLTAALKENPQAVADLLGGEGAAGKLGGYIGHLTRYGEGLIDSRNQGIESRVRDIDRQVDNMRRRLEQREQTLRNQFLAAERMIGQMNTQSQWLEQQLNSLANLQTAGSNRRW